MHSNSACGWRVQDANGSSALSPRSPFDEVGGTLLANGRVRSSDVDGVVSELRANQHSSARDLDRLGDPLQVTITFEVISLPRDDAAEGDPHGGNEVEYVQVLMHAFEAGAWTAPRANIFSSAFESRANSSAKGGGESPARADSNISGAMPVVSLRGAPRPCYRAVAFCLACCTVTRQAHHKQWSAFDR
jgi:hypothetical protein